MDLSWWSIEVRDSWRGAALWHDTHRQTIIEAAITSGAREWNYELTKYGVVIEIAYSSDDEDAWQRFRHLPAVVAALDAVPAEALYVYPGRGGTAGAGLPRHPRRPLGAGAAPLPEEPMPVIVARAELLAV